MESSKSKKLNAGPSNEEKHNDSKLLTRVLINIKRKIVIRENPCLKGDRKHLRIKEKKDSFKSDPQNPNPSRPIPWAQKVIRAS